MKRYIVAKWKVQHKCLKTKCEIESWNKVAAKLFLAQGIERTSVGSLIFGKDGKISLISMREM